MSLVNALISLNYIEPVAPGMIGSEGWCAVAQPDGTRILMGKRRDASYKEAVREGLLWEDLEFPAEPRPIEEAISSQENRAYQQPIYFTSLSGGRCAPSKPKKRASSNPEKERRKANKAKRFIPRRLLEATDATVNSDTAFCTTCQHVEPCKTEGFITHFEWCDCCRTDFLMARDRWMNYRAPEGVCEDCWFMAEAINRDWYESGEVPWVNTEYCYKWNNVENVNAHCYCDSHYYDSDDDRDDDSWDRWSSYGSRW
jgi:hypothetical protein